MTHDEYIENEVDQIILDNQDAKEAEEIENMLDQHDCKISEEDGCNCGDWRERLNELRR